jgi:hypothetical protein
MISDVVIKRCVVWISEERLYAIYYFSELCCVLTLENNITDSDYFLV